MLCEIKAGAGRRLVPVLYLSGTSNGGRCTGSSACAQFMGERWGREVVCGWWIRSAGASIKRIRDGGWAVVGLVLCGMGMVGTRWQGWYYAGRGWWMTGSEVDLGRVEVGGWAVVRLVLGGLEWLGESRRAGLFLTWVSTFGHGGPRSRRNGCRPFAAGGVTF
jgi:hypothetical protein